MTKPKLLLISGISPFPQTSGGATRIKQTLLHLSKKYEIYFYFFLADDQPLTAEDKAFLNQQTVFYQTFSFCQKSILTSLKQGIPYHLSNYFSLPLIQELQQTLNNCSFSKIRIETTQLLYLAKYLKTRQLDEFVALDISTVSFYRRAFASKNPLQILIRLFSCLQVYFYEKNLLKYFSKVLVMSRKDAFFIKKLFSLDQIQISPNGIEKIDFLAPRNKEKLTIAFVGSVEHTPNKKALDFLLLKILPALQLEQIDCEVLVLGKNNHLFYQNLANVEFIDYINDLRDFYAKIDLLVAPIFAGSGTRLKILESLSYGRPVITTEIGAEGIEIESKLLSVINDRQQNNVKNWTKSIRNLFDEYKNKSNQIELDKLKQELYNFLWSKIFKE